MSICSTKVALVLGLAIDTFSAICIPTWLLSVVLGGVCVCIGDWDSIAGTEVILVSRTIEMKMKEYFEMELLYPN